MGLACRKIRGLSTLSRRLLARVSPLATQSPLSLLRGRASRVMPRARAHPSARDRAAWGISARDRAAWGISARDRAAWGFGRSASALDIALPATFLDRARSANPSQPGNIVSSLHEPERTDAIPSAGALQHVGEANPPVTIERRRVPAEATVTRAKPRPPLRKRSRCQPSGSARGRATGTRHRAVGATSSGCEPCHRRTPPWAHTAECRPRLMVWWRKGGTRRAQPYEAPPLAGAEVGVQSWTRPSAQSWTRPNAGRGLDPAPRRQLSEHSGVQSQPATLTPAVPACDEINMTR